MLPELFPEGDRIKRKLVVCFRPGLEPVVEDCRRSLIPRSDDATVGDEGAEPVFGMTVLLNGRLYFRGRIQPFPLPGQATFESPLEDSGQLLLQLRGKFRVLLRRWNSHLEGDKVNSAPDR